jgi:DNA-binding NtrC family response regulator
LTLCFHPDLERVGEVATLDLGSASVQIDRTSPRFRQPGAPDAAARGLATSFISDRAPMQIELNAEGGVRLIPPAAASGVSLRLPERRLELKGEPFEVAASELSDRGVILVINHSVVLLLHHVSELCPALDEATYLELLRELYRQVRALAANAPDSAAVQSLERVEQALRGPRRTEAASLTWLAQQIREAASLSPAGSRDKHADIIRRTESLILGLAQLDRLQHGVVGASPALQRLWSAIGSLPHDGSVMLLGEQGSGKSEVARAIARFSRRERPLVYKNAAGLLPSVAAAELFGRKKGFLGSDDAGVLGIFRAADRGTLFLDEIGELNEEVQAKLLDAVERDAITPVGDGEVAVDVRLITASNRDLRAGRFKKDLYDRLAGLQLTVPSLRERRDDIPRLLVHFLREYWHGRLQAAPETRGQRADWASQWAEFVVRLLCDPWPGNVRVLRDVVHRLALANPITLATESLRFVAPEWDCANAPALASRSAAPSFKELTALPSEAQRARLEQLLAEHGSQRKAAAALDVSGPTLNRLCKKHGLHVSELNDAQLDDPPKWANAKAVSERRKQRTSTRLTRSSS